MQVTTVPSNQEYITTVAIRWLTRVLDDPGMYYSNFPNEIKGYLYIDGVPKLLSYGPWEISDCRIYLPSRSSSVEPLTKLAVLSAIASMTKAPSDPAIVNKITQKLVTILNETTKNIYNSIITATHAPSRLAIDQEGLQIAAELNGAWLLTNGAPVEVTDRWITMDF